MKKGIKALLWVGGVLAAVGLFLLFAFINHKLSKVPEIPATAENDTGLVIAVGRGLYDANGKELVLRGVNAGTTFVTEGWLAPYCVAEPEEGSTDYPTLSEEQFLAGFKSNPNLTDAQREELLNIYYDNWFTKEDVKNIAELGMNCLRIPFYYTMILNEDYSRKAEDVAFARLDEIIGWCEEYGIYVILDLHGAPLSQNGYEHSGAMKYNKKKDTILLWDDAEAVKATVDLWRYIAEHYKSGELGKMVASYDILNEPRSKRYCTDKTCWAVFDQIYDAVRATGDKHNITMEGCWDFTTLPNPEKYGWENVTYSYHWYNWASNYVTYTMFYMYQDLTNIGRHYDVPVFIGEFTCFDKAKDWNQELTLFADRHYSWTIWTYKMGVYGWWENSWGLYNLNFWEGDYRFAHKINVSTASYDEIREVFEWCVTENASKSSTYDTIKNFLKE